MNIDDVYGERNELAVAFCKAALAAGWKAGRGFDTGHADWDDEWKHLIYIDLPNGEQVSWHMAPNEVHLLEGLPEYDGQWDGTFVGRSQGWTKLF